MSDLPPGFFQNSHQQILQNENHIAGSNTTNSPSLQGNQTSDFVTNQQPQIKQQPHTPVPSPLPPSSQNQLAHAQQQHTLDLINTSQNGDTNNSLNLVSALTAAINANSTSVPGAKTGSASTPKTLPTRGENNMISNSSSNKNSDSINKNISVAGSNIDQHLNNTSLNETSSSHISLKSNELQNKFSRKYLK